MSFTAAHMCLPLPLSQLRDVEREPHVQLEQSGQQFFLNISGPHSLEPRSGRAGHSPHMVRTCPLLFTNQTEQPCQHW